MFEAVLNYDYAVVSGRGIAIDDINVDAAIATLRRREDSPPPPKHLGRLCFQVLGTFLLGRDSECGNCGQVPPAESPDAGRAWNLLWFRRPVRLRRVNGDVYDVWLLGRIASTIRRPGVGGPRIPRWSWSQGSGGFAYLRPS